MNTTIYLIRHSTKFSPNDIEEYKTSQDKKIKDEKVVLSVEGEKRAEKLAYLEELQNLDKVYVSNCVRTLQTAKYLLEKQNLKVTIDERFNERKSGIPNDIEFPDWYKRQYWDENFHTINGESQKNVRKRFGEAFDEVVNDNRGKRIAIFAHGISITMFLRRWLELKDVGMPKRGVYSYKFDLNGEKFYDGVLETPYIFKVELDENDKVVSLSHFGI